MKLAKNLTTVTPFSRVLALVLFISLPFLGFYLGRLYQSRLCVSQLRVIKSCTSKQPTITPQESPSPSRTPAQDSAVSSGYIKKISVQNGATMIDYDMVQWLDDNANNFAGSRACLEDGRCQKDWCQPDSGRSCLPNGYYIRNQNTKIRTYTLTPSVRISTLKNGADGFDKLSLKQFIELFNTTDPQSSWHHDSIYDLTLNPQGQVTDILERYQP